MARSVYTVQLFQGLVVFGTPQTIFGGAGSTVVIRDIQLKDNETPAGSTLQLLDGSSGLIIRDWSIGPNAALSWEGRIASLVGFGFTLEALDEIYATVTGYLLSS